MTINNHGYPLITMVTPILPVKVFLLPYALLMLWSQNPQPLYSAYLPGTLVFLVITTWCVTSWHVVCDVMTRGVWHHDTWCVTSWHVVCNVMTRGVWRHDTWCVTSCHVVHEPSPLPVAITRGVWRHVTWCVTSWHVVCEPSPPLSSYIRSLWQPDNSTLQHLVS